MAQTATKNTYEVMFLVNQAEAASLSSLVEHINEILSRAGADIISMRKWDERRLAYPIDKQKRGVYFLAYVEMDGEGPSHIERDVVISEKVMRVLVTRADQRDYPAMEHALNDHNVAVYPVDLTLGPKSGPCENRTVF